MDPRTLMIVMMIQDNNVALENTLNKIKECQVHEINRGRARYSEYSYLFPILKKYDDKFYKYMRMQIQTFHYILSKIEMFLTKNWCNLHTQPILAEERLVITLRYSTNFVIINYFSL